MGLLADIREDAQYKSFKKIFAVVQERVDVETSFKEVMGLHASRLSRSLSGSKRYSPQTLIDANLKDLANRARMVEIRVKNDKQLSHLREAMAAMKRHIRTEYAEDLREFSTEGQRTAFTDRVLKSANEFLAEGESLLSTIDMLIKDVDQAGFSMRNNVELLKLLSSSKGGQVV